MRRATGRSASRIRAAGETGTLNWFRVVVFGSAASADDVYHYTDEFLAMAALAGEGGRATLTDGNGGTDWIDAAAVTGNVIARSRDRCERERGRLVHHRGRHRERRDRRRQRQPHRHRRRQQALRHARQRHDLRPGRRRHGRRRAPATTPRCSPANLASYAPQDLGTRITVSGLEGNDTLFGIEHLAVRRRHRQRRSTATRCSTRCST